MKKLIATSFLILWVGLGFSQVKFTPMNFDQARQRAKAESKQLLVDVVMGKTPNPEIAKLFKDKELAKFINQNFVAARIDMMAPENEKFGDYLYSLMFPCVVFYSDRGEQLEFTNWNSLAIGKQNLRELAQKSLETVAVKRANSRQIEFRKLDFKQAVDAAKKEGKLLFIDNFTTWCRPCKMMEMDVFTLNSVADFYNENFVCIQIDDSKDSDQLAKKYNVRGFPAYLYFDGEGELVLKEGGFTPEQGFIGYGQNALKRYHDNQEIRLQKISLDEAKALAQKEHKMIFVDLSATWCGPCKQLKATTFKSPTVARFYNDNFISVFVECDIQKELAAELKKAYGYSAFPTMLYLDAQGVLIHKFVGAGFPDSEFIETGRKALENKGLKYYQDRYDAGEKTGEFVREYVKVLDTANEKTRGEEVATEYLNQLTLEQLLEPENRSMMESNISELDAAPAQLFLANFAKFAEKDQMQAKNYRMLLWYVKSRSYVRKGETSVLDKAGYTAFLERLKRSDLPEELKTDILADSKLSNAENLNDWETYTSIVMAEMKKLGAKSSLPKVFNQGLRVNQRCEDTRLRLKYAGALETLLSELDKAHVQNQMNDAYIKAIRDVIGDLRKH